MDCEDLPLPPNWESRFDSSSRRWFFINHSLKATTWDDPRPAYYASQRSTTAHSATRTSGHPQPDSCDHGLLSESPSTSDSPYSLADADFERSISPRFRSETQNDADVEAVDEDESGTPDFLSYLSALRASYPELKERQLGRLLEDYLGDSPELRTFISTHLRRYSSERVSERQKKKGTPSNAGQARRTHSGLDGSKSPTNTTTQSRQVSGSQLSTPTDAALKGRATEPTSPRSERVEGTPKYLAPPKDLRQPSDSASGHLSTTTLKPSESETSHPLTHPEEVAVTQPQKPVDTTLSDTQISEPADLLSSSKPHESHRIKPRGPDPSIRVHRIKPLGHNPDLVKGPSKHLVSGPLAARPKDRERC